jgi:hypothetical protein
MSAPHIKLVPRAIPEEVIDRAEYARRLLLMPRHEAEKRGDFLSVSPILAEASGIYADIAAEGYGEALTKELQRRVDEYIEQY